MNENTLMQYIFHILQSTADEVGWRTDTSAIHGIIDASVEAYGTTSLELVTDAVKIRALVRYQTWLTVLATVVPLVDSADGNTSAKYSQITTNARAMLSLAERDARPHLAVGAAAGGVSRSRSTPLEVVF